MFKKLAFIIMKSYFATEVYFKRYFKKHMLEPIQFLVDVLENITKILMQL